MNMAKNFFRALSEGFNYVSESSMLCGIWFERWKSGKIGV